MLHVVSHLKTRRYAINFARRSIGSIFKASCQIVLCGPEQKLGPSIYTAAATEVPIVAIIFWPSG